MSRNSLLYVIVVISLLNYEISALKDVKRQQNSRELNDRISSIPKEVESTLERPEVNYKAKCLVRLYIANYTRQQSAPEGVKPIGWWNFPGENYNAADCEDEILAKKIVNSMKNDTIFDDLSLESMESIESLESLEMLRFNSELVNILNEKIKAKRKYKIKAKGNVREQNRNRGMRNKREIQIDQTILDRINSQILNFSYPVILVPIIDVQTYCYLWTCGKEHIACNATNELGRQCPNNTQLIDINDYKEDILNFHNIKRNIIAMGANELPPAARMARMQWDDELAYFAELNVKRCFMKSDKCHNTRNFKYSGQNLGIITYSGNNDYTKPKDLILENLEYWFSKWEQLTTSMIKNFDHENLYRTVSIMINDQSTHVGCAAILYRVASDNTFYFVCNYSHNNIMNKPVYEESTSPTSKCSSGRSFDFPYLCSPTESYNNIDLLDDYYEYN